MRRKDNKYGYSSFTEEELRKYLKWLTIPGILVILVLAVILAKNLAGGSSSDSSQTSVQAEQLSGEGDLGEGQQEAVTDPAESGSEQSGQETSGETQAEQTEENFAKDSVPEINALMERYFTAKQNADIETMYQLFGRTDMEGAEALESPSIRATCRSRIPP